MFIYNLKGILNRIKDKFGEGFFTVFGICAFLFMLCGLAIGLLGRGWLYAWLFVFFGAVFAFFPVANFLVDYYDENVPKEGRVVELSSDEVAKRNEEKDINIDSPQKDIKDKNSASIKVDDATKAALELEAALAKARIRKEKQRQNAIREAEERYEADRAAYLARKERLLREAYEREAKKAAQERARIEEERRKNREFNENVFKKNTIKKASLADGYFKGVSNSAELKKRYKDLMKIYHPDNTAGDADVMRKIKSEYEELTRFYAAYDKH